MLNGRDSKQFEGPMGESILPSASVDYERVIINNINSGKTSTGFMVNTYHTCKEFPVTRDWSSISKHDETYRKTNLTVPLGIFSLTIQKAWVAQGYIFKLNDMHGKINSTATYAGNYSPVTFNETAYTSQTTYTYSNPGTPISTLVYNSNPSDPNYNKISESTLSPGTEEDFTAFMSDVDERTNDFQLEIDLDLTIPFFITLGFCPNMNVAQSKLCQHSTSKIVSQVSYLLSTTTTTDGVTQTTENLAFDKYTGDPVLTRTYDGYSAPAKILYTQQDNSGHNGYYYSLNIPASWMYADMAPQSISSTNANQLTASIGNVVTYGGNALYDAIVPSGDQTWDPQASQLQNVVNASATVYKNNWFTSNNVPGSFLTTFNTHRYPLRTYVYRDNVKDANQSNVEIYGGGTVVSPFSFFNWNAGDATYQDPVNGNQIGNWYSPSQVVAYSPYGGYPIEEVDVLGISSTAKYGYDNTLPLLVAQNAKNAEVFFLDFESRNGFTNITTDDAHSGQSSLQLNSSPSYVFAGSYPISNDMLTKNGLGIRLWLKSTLNAPNNIGMKNDNPQLKALIGGVPFDFKRIAQTGNWALYIVEIPSNSFKGLSAGNYDVQLSYNFNTALNEQVLVDDFRIQPLNSMMNCTVYTNDNKVAAQFDDQHFGVYYEYNHKGQLVRKSIETERGKKTLQEQQYNTPLINNN